MIRPTRPAEYPGCPATVISAQADGAVLRPTGWGLRDACIAFLGTFAASIVLATLLAATGPLPQGWYLVVGAMVPWLAMAGWPLYATARYGNGATIDLGLSFRWSDLLWGVLGGICALALGSVAAVAT